MFERLEPLQFEQHKSLRFQPPADYRFALRQQFVPLSYTEILEAAKHYPIVFPPPEQGRLPVALLGLARGRNAFVDEDGRWTAPMVPAHIQRYPFILGAANAGEDFAVMVDREAPHFQGEDGEPLFSEDGKPAAVLRQVMDFLTRFQQETALTEQFVAALHTADVLVAQQVAGQRQGKSGVPLVTGFQVVHQERLDALADETFLDWRRRRMLPLIYAHLASLTNIGRLPLPEGEQKE